MKRKELSWKPVRKGHTYCAPACGRGCTHTEYLSAVKAGEALAAQAGPGWRGEVHENLGWHHKAISRNSVLAVYDHSRKRTKRYWATTVDIYPQFHAESRSPRGAIKAILHEVRSHAKKIAEAARTIHDESA